MPDLRWLQPDRDRSHLAGEGRHVPLARVALPILVIAIIAVTWIWMQVNPETAVKKVDVKDIQNTLDEARFTSVDDKGRPFAIEADKVLQQNPSTMTATLAGPRGDITLDKGDKLSLKAQKGVYDHPNKMLHLNGVVTLERNADLTITTDQLDVNLNDQSARGNARVNGSTKDGSTIEADGVQVAPGATRLIFTGPAKLTIMPKEKKTDTP